MIKDKFFLFNFSKILGAAFIAQIIPVLISPVISRIYSVEDIGVQGVVYSIVGFCWIFSTLRYDNVIIIDRLINPIRNFITVKKITVITSIFLTVIIILFINQLSEYFNLNEPLVLLMVPLIVYINASYELLIIYNNRVQNFDNIAKIKVSQSSISGIFQLVFGFMGLNYFGLILAPLISKFVPYFKSKLFRMFFIKPKLYKKDFILIDKYKKFPLFDLPSSLINNLSLQLPIILLASNYSLVISGAYFMTQRVLQIPITLFSHSFLEVFKEKICDTKNQFKLRKLMLDSLILILSVSFVPFVLLFIFVEDLIVIFLGENWIMAAKFGKILVPSLFFRFISYPLSYIILLKQKQQINLIFNIISLAFVIILFSSKIDVYSLFLKLSILFSLQSIIRILYSFSLTKNISNIEI
jgi:O-antigen/teichoic acid export membrane protein